MNVTNTWNSQALAVISLSNVHTDMMRNESRQAETELKHQIQGLQNELKDRKHDIEILQATIDRMRARTSEYIVVRISAFCNI